MFLDLVLLITINVTIVNSNDEGVDISSFTMPYYYYYIISKSQKDLFNSFITDRWKIQEILSTLKKIKINLQLIILFLKVQYQLPFFIFYIYWQHHMTNQNKTEKR